MTLAVILLVSFRADISGAVNGDYSLVELIPYIIVLIGGIAGINVFIVLIAGIVSGAVINIIFGQIGFTKLLGEMGTGASGMYETIMVTVLVSALCGLMRAYGGFDAILWLIKKVFKGRRGGQIGIGILVTLMDIATANNTVAIVMAGPIAKEMSVDYGIEPKRSASLLDTFSCIIQGILPYGAQMLYAVGAVATLGKTVSAFEIIPFMFYPLFLLAATLIYIAVAGGRSKKENLDNAAVL